MNKVGAQEASSIKGVKLKQTGKVVGVTKENLLALMTPSNELNELNKTGTKISFKNTIDAPEEFEQLLLFLYDNGVEDLTVKLENGEIIENPLEAVGHDTFIFFDPAVETILGWYFKINSKANIIQKGNTIFISKTIN